MTRILIIKDKDDTRYFDVETDLQLHITSVQIIKERLKLGWYGEPKEDPTYPEDIPTKEEIDKMQEGAVKKACQNTHDNWMYHFKRHQQEQTVLSRLKVLIEARCDSPEDVAVRNRWAATFLQSRDGYEYEGAELITPKESNREPRSNPYTLISNGTPRTIRGLQ